MSSGGESRLVVVRDGAALPEEEARELWREFSAHMDVNQGDMAGFAAKKGWYSVLPEHRAGKAVLVVSTTEAASKVAAQQAAKAAAKPAMKAAAKPAPKGGGKGGPRVGGASKGVGRPGGGKPGGPKGRR